MNCRQALTTSPGLIGALQIDRNHIGVHWPHQTFINISRALPESPDLVIASRVFRLLHWSSPFLLRPPSIVALPLASPRSTPSATAIKTLELDWGKEAQVGLKIFKPNQLNPRELGLGKLIQKNPIPYRVRSKRVLWARPTAKEPNPTGPPHNPTQFGD